MANGWSCNGTRFCIRLKIFQLDCWSFTECEILYHCTNQYHSPFVLYNTWNVNYIVNWLRLIIWISNLGWVKFQISFSSSWLDIASAQPTRNAYFIHKTILVCDKIPKSTLIRIAKLLWHHALLKNGTKLHNCAMVRSAARSAPIGLYATSLLGVIQMDLIWCLFPILVSFKRIHEEHVRHHIQANDSYLKCKCIAH